jgi:cytochrome c-type biogenesis protein CcmH/NrfG
VAAVAFAVAIGGGTLWWHYSGRLAHREVQAPTPYEDDPRARELYKSARFKLWTRTADALALAEKEFRRLTEQYPDRAAGWSGLADTYLMEREFGSLSDNQGFSEAARAANTAISLDPSRADAWLDRGFIAFWWEGDTAAAFRAFDTAVKLDPTSPRAFHWYGTALAGAGDFTKSLSMLAKARALDPGNRAIVADESWIVFCAGRHTEGLAALESLVQLDPKFVAWHKYLARAYLVMSRNEDFLKEALLAAQLRGQSDEVAGLNLAEAQFRAGGRQAMLDQLTSNAVEAFRRGNGSATVVAAYRVLANDRSGALTWLAAAEAARDFQLMDVRSAPEFENYRLQPDFIAFQPPLRK